MDFSFSFTLPIALSNKIWIVFGLIDKKCSRIRWVSNNRKRPVEALGKLP